MSSAPNLTFKPPITRSNKRVLASLLIDQTRSMEGCQADILPADDIYRILPRAFKHQHMQTARAKSCAEVFTPAWICNAQNNLIDEQWFGRPDVFNVETVEADGNHTWHPTASPVTFPPDKAWLKYVQSRRMEFACGEAPYLASRYDSTSGLEIPLSKRIGILDRKFRVINENTPHTDSENARRTWLNKAFLALQSTYGFDLQADNVFLARENIFNSFCDYCLYRWQRLPRIEIMLKAAEIITWNIWQMDGISHTVPDTQFPCYIMAWRGASPLKGEKVMFKRLISKQI